MDGRGGEFGGRGCGEDFRFAEMRGGDDGAVRGSAVPESDFILFTRRCLGIMSEGFEGIENLQSALMLLLVDPVGLQV